LRLEALLPAFFLCGGWRMNNSNLSGKGNQGRPRGFQNPLGGWFKTA
jgi:hypothetical protein